MKVVDANVLLYAVDADARHHEASRAWLDSALSGGDTVGFAWIALLAFVRLGTKPGLYPEPMSVADAMEQVDAWTTAPTGRIVAPGAEHGRLLRNLLADAGSGGNLVNDAHLAAIAVEQRADVVSYDSDFGRFPGVRCRRPDQLLK